MKTRGKRGKSFSFIYADINRLSEEINKVLIIVIVTRKFSVTGIFMWNRSFSACLFQNVKHP